MLGAIHLCFSTVCIMRLLSRSMIHTLLVCYGLEFRVWGLEFGVWGLGFGVLEPVVCASEAVCVETDDADGTRGNVRLWVVGCGLWVVGCGLWVVGCGLWVVGCGLWVGVWGLGFGVLTCTEAAAAFPTELQLCA